MPSVSTLGRIPVEAVAQQTVPVYHCICEELIEMKTVGETQSLH